MFWQLSESWENLQNTAIVLTKQNQIVMTLQSYVTQLSVDDRMLKSILGGDCAISDADRLKKDSTASLYSLEYPSNSLTIIEPDQVNNYETIPFMVNFLLLY